MLDYYNREKLASQHTKATVRAAAQDHHGASGSETVEYVRLSMGMISLFLLVVAITLLSLLHAAIAHLNAWLAGLNAPLYLPGS